jgi:DNA-binding PadR family transcriptional regulator
MSRKLPAVTHLQFLVLDALAEAERAGRDLRALLADHGIRNSGPAFYQMMGRLEEGGLVEGWYDGKIIDRQHVKERRYRLTKAGARAAEDTRAFYLERVAAARSVRKGSHA